MTKNLHLPHPEDTILTGNLSALHALYAPFADFSVKFDGAPAVVWGRNPATGKFFVGTKSVFNKHEIDITYLENTLPREYSQLHPKLGFINNISALDFIFNVGNDWERYYTL